MPLERCCPQRPDYKQIIISATENEGALIKVFADDKLVGCAPWHPYEVDITESIKSDAGKIELEVVLTRRNTFGPLHQIPLKAHAYGPGNFTTAGENFSENYMLYPAGLLASPEMRYGVQK